MLPAFAMDCGDWLVATPSQAGLPDDVEGAPLLAALSTVVLGEDTFRSVSAVLTLGLLDDDLRTQPVGGGVGEPLRYVLPAPSGHLALVARFETPDGADAEVVGRIEALMASFRWVRRDRRARLR